jgi:hypothetical protein
MADKREYFDIELKNQSKPNLAKLGRLAEFGGTEHDRHASKYFTGKLAWRNPLIVRVSFPRLKRWEFIKATGLWCDRPHRIGVPEMPKAPAIRLRGNHDEMRGRRRSYHLGGGLKGMVRDWHPVLGQRDFDGVVSDVLDGNLDIVLDQDQAISNA